MRRRTLTGCAASMFVAGALVSAMAVLAPTGATATPQHADRSATTGTSKAATPNGRVAAAKSAAQLIRSKPQVLKASKHDAFEAGKVLSSMGLNYVPYERTYRALSVVGGDFVVATDDRGRIVATSIAQTRQVRLRTTRATVAKSTARATSKRQLRHARLGHPARRAAAALLQAGVGDLGDRSQARRGLAVDGVRRRAHRPRPHHP